MSYLLAILKTRTLCNTRLRMCEKTQRAVCRSTNKTNLTNLTNTHTCFLSQKVHPEVPQLLCLLLLKYDIFSAVIHSAMPHIPAGRDVLS